MCFVFLLFQRIANAIKQMEAHISLLIPKSLAGISYRHGIALPKFSIVCSFFYKKSKHATVLTFLARPLPREVPDVAKEQI